MRFCAVHTGIAEGSDTADFLIKDHLINCVMLLEQQKLVVLGRALAGSNDLSPNKVSRPPIGLKTF